MELVFSEYRSLLHAVQEQLERLIELTEQNGVMGSPELEWMDKITYQEEALMEAIRAWEQKRAERSAWYTDTTVLPDCFPSVVQLEARQVVEKLQKQYYASVGESSHATESEAKGQNRHTQYTEQNHSILLEDSQVDFHA